jgi:hypothetical protein
MSPVTTASAGTCTSMVMYSARTAYELMRSWHASVAGGSVAVVEVAVPLHFPDVEWFLCARGRICVS